jgi:tetratricopeptide (TPR) repeat protein
MAIELDRTNLDIRAKYAQTCRDLHMHSEATAEFKTLAQLARDKDEFEKAKVFYRQIIEMNPSDPEFRQRYFEMLLEHGDAESRKAGLELAESYRKLGLKKEEVPVLEKVVLLDENDCEVRERLGDARMGCGDSKEAMDEYLFTAQRCINNNDTIKAAKLYKKVLAIKPDDTKVKQTLDDLLKGIYHEKQHRRRKIFTTVEIVIAALLITGFILYNAVAAGSFLLMNRLNLFHVGNGNFELVYENIDSFSSRYPYALVNLSLDDYISTVQDIQKMASNSSIAATIIQMLDKNSTGAEVMEVDSIDTTSASDL